MKYIHQTFNHALSSRETFDLDYPEIIVDNYEFILVAKVGKKMFFLPYWEILT